MSRKVRLSKDQIDQMPSVLKNWFEGFDKDTEFVVTASRVSIVLVPNKKGKHTMETYRTRMVKEERRRTVLVCGIVTGRIRQVWN